MSYVVPCKLVQFLNAELLMVVPLVNTTVVKLVLGIAEIAVVGIVAVVMLLQPPNALALMEVTESGIVMLVRLVQL